MAVELTGTPTAIIWAGGADPAAQSITIPSDATAVYVFGTMWAAVALDLSTITLNGASPNQTFTLPRSGDEPCSWVAAFYNPATGSQSLNPAWTNSPSEGPTCVAAYVKGGDTSAWRDADADGASNNDPVTVTLTTVSGDLVLKYDQRFHASETPPALSAGWTSGQTTGNVDEGARLSWITATGATQVCNGEDENFSTVCAISIPAASADRRFFLLKVPG